MKTPMIYGATQLNNWPTTVVPHDQVPYMARPMGWQGSFVIHRLRLAWGVFTGKYDALRWPNGQ